MTMATRISAATTRAVSRRSRPSGFGRSSTMVATVARDEVLVDDAMHVQDVALLPGVQTGTGPSRRPHSLLDVAEILVVLLGDLAPVAIAPVLEELGRDAPIVGGVGRAPLEDPGVL